MAYAFNDNKTKASTYSKAEADEKFLTKTDASSTYAVADTVNANGWVTTNRIAGDAVTSTKIADGNVTTSKLANNAVTTVKIADSNVTTAKLADGAVTTAKLADSNVTTAKIADSNVTTAKIANGAITTDKIADGAITSSKIANEDILLIFGDSWCNFVDHPDWSIGVNKVLGCGTVLNYGVGGAGFTVSGNLISTQINTAKSELSADQKAHVKYIVIMAGVNDCNPRPASNLASSFDSAMQNVKNAFPNALIEWCPTTCEPSYNNSVAPKWLYTIASFWYLVGRYFAASDPDDEPSRFCAPSCGPMFYFNHITTPIATFFDNSKLHLSKYGRNAIVNAVLDGFGLGNEPFFISRAIARGDYYISLSATPTNITIRGAYNNAGTSDLGPFGARLLGVMAAEQAYCMFVNSFGPQQYALITTAAANDTSYLNLEPISSYTGLQLGTAGSYSSGLYFVS